MNCLATPCWSTMEGCPSVKPVPMGWVIHTMLVRLVQLYSFLMGSVAL